MTHRMPRRGRADLMAELAAARVRADTRRAWETGLIVPWRITHALDARGLEGPGVDHACGVEEPTVDQWEAGIVYPTWAQLQALATLTDFPIGWFGLAGAPIPIERTSLWFHMTARERARFVAEPAVLHFQRTAVLKTLRAENISTHRVQTPLSLAAHRHSADEPLYLFPYPDR